METNKCCEKCQEFCDRPRSGGYNFSGVRLPMDFCPCHSEPEQELEGLVELIQETITKIESIGEPEGLEWRKNIMKMVKFALNLEDKDPIPYFIINAVDGAYVAGLQDKAQAHNLGKMEERVRVKKLVEGMKLLRKPTHGTCCTCQTCGWDNDGGCECPRNKILTDLAASLTEGGENGK